MRYFKGLRSLDEYRSILLIGLIFTFFPLLISLIATLVFFPYSNYSELNFCKDVSCINDFFSENFSSFLWFEGWLGIVYNLATIFGIFIAVFTYKKNSESQSMVNHFSNLGLFNTYVTEEIKKLDYLHLSSFDIVMWYRCIYDKSKNGSLECSDEYAILINEYRQLIEKSNSLKTSGPNKGYNYKNHQEKARSIFLAFGVNFQEASRTGFKEIEDQMHILLEKVNISFICSDKLKSLPEASYK